jgi:hypothetical protein
MGFGAWLGKIFKPVGRFLGNTVKGIGKAASWIGRRLSPFLSIGSGIARDIASNPLAQMAATAIGGPGAGLMMNAVGSGANFVNQVVGPRDSRAGGMVSGLIRGANDVASLQQRYVEMRNR